MTIPAPTDIDCRHEGGWAYLTIPVKRGHSIEVQYNDGRDWHAAHKQVSEYLVPMYQVGNTEWRARYTRGGEHGAWATGRVWMPTGFHQDESDPQPKPPKPPTGLRIVDTDPSAGTARVAWDGTRQHEDSFWRVLLEDVDTTWRNVRTPGTTFKHLEAGRTYGWRVKTIDVDEDGFEHESAPVRGPEFELDGDPPPPPPVDPPSSPRALRVHCIHPHHAKVEWDANPPEEGVTSYLVTLDGTTQREVIGTLVELRDLTPETTYTVDVRACRDQDCSPPTRQQFTTGSEAPPPQPDPPDGAPTAPSGLYVDPIGPGRIELSWTQPHSDAPVDWWSATPDGGATWHRATGRTIRMDVPPGAQLRVGVAAVSNGRNGRPTRLSAPTMSAVKTAQKGA